MNVVTIALLTAAAALISAIIGPLMSFVVASRQIRATVISSNRERWIEALRDSIAEYVGLLLTAAMVRQGMEKDTNRVVRRNHDLREIVERLVLVKNKIMLMLNPNEERGARLCELIEATYLSLASDEPATVVTMRAQADAITKAGREVLRAEWGRVKRGE
jgi:hypothetical protein